MNTPNWTMITAAESSNLLVDINVKELGLGLPAICEMETIDPDNSCYPVFYIRFVYIIIMKTSVVGDKKR